ncbi:hypothetical protein FRC08_000534 [Ceratobasidium sp. 394]|nr:hypothetical protein FRC08_000534 [Ceratobasidium sp. 394]KAG9085868.1 hypothetical protein FS749_004053 [Ceratobasidium sp. UAMH 11750]
MTGIPTSFQTWYDASKQLTESIQRYLDASLALESAITYRPENDLDAGALEKLFDAVQAELVSRYSRNDKTKRSYIALCRVFNQSTKFVPIQRLPPELLVRIFSLACQRCGFFPSSEPKISKCQTTKTMLTITRVCADWRKLAIGTPKLWAHVDIIDRAGYHQEREHEGVWLERARNVPLSVQFFLTPYPNNPLSLLGPHLGAIRSLGFQSDSPSSLHAAIAYWMSNGTPGSVQELSLIGPKEFCRFGGPPCMDKDVDFSLFHSFTAPLKVLRLRHVELKSSGLYRGLEHLELSYLHLHDDSIWVFHVLKINSSPGLRTLKLDTLKMLDDPIPATVKPTKLDALERLELINLTPDPCSRLLPLLVPGPGELSLRLEAEVNPQNVDMVVSFLKRSNVTKLYLKISSNETLAVDWLASVPNLRMLVLDFAGSSYDICGSVLNTLVYLSESSTGWCPKLRTLWLIEFCLGIEDLKRIVEKCGIRALILSVFGSLNGSLRKDILPLVHKVISERVLPNSVIAEWYSRG